MGTRHAGGRGKANWQRPKQELSAGRCSVKQYSRLLAPFIALLFNASLSTGCFPAKFKHAIVTPLEKKGTRDSSHLKNYCPVSNLPFLSKLLEKVVQKPATTSYHQ